MEELNQIENVILHYLQGCTSEDEMRTLTDWLNESNENRTLLFELKDVYELRKGGLYPDKEEIRQSLLRLNKKMEVAAAHKKRASFKRYLIGFCRYAAVAAVAAFFALETQKVLRKEVPVNVTFTEVEVEAGSRMSRLALSDGTKVVLNASTKFRFPDRFAGDEREVFLDGEAFFDVAHNETMPFTVLTDKQRISVLGTVFNVMDYSSNSYAVTTLVDGSVKIEPLSEGTDGSEGTGVATVLKPNQQAFFDGTSAELTVTDVEVDLDRIWVNKVYRFRDEPLGRIMQRLEKFYGVRIVIADKDLQNEKYTGTFATDKGIESILEIIRSYDNRFTYVIKDDIITINAKKMKEPMQKRE